MLKKPEEAQQEMEFVTIESPINLEFIRGRVKHLYCADNGRPALDPVMLFELLLIGYLYGIRSERQLMRAVQVNAAHRWYLRLKLNDKIPATLRR